MPACAKRSLLYQNPTMLALYGMPYCLPSTWYSLAAPSLRSPTKSDEASVMSCTKPGVDLIAQATAAPRLEQVGHVTGLQVGLQRRLERLVLHHGDVDRDVRVLGRVGVGHRLPVGLARIVVLDVPPVDLDCLAITARVGGGRVLGGAASVAGAALSEDESSSLPHAAATRPSAATSTSARRRSDGWVVFISYPPRWM